MKVRVVLADDHRILREGLRSIIERDLRMEVVGHAENGRDAVALVRTLNPDIVIMDIHMPELNGTEATRIIAREFPHVKVIALSMHSDRGIILEILRAGASGYLLKDCATDELERAIRTVMAHKTYVSPDVTGIVIDELRGETNNTSTNVLHALTGKEREVLQLLSEGKTVKEISGVLGVSIPTVETHKQHLMCKLKISSIAELTKFAIRHGITSLD
jgi:DNA-binding NarL/FixJ family response regulator